MSQNQPRRTETAEKISVLIRIFRSAVQSGDMALRDATAIELRVYGINTADLYIPQVSKGGEAC